LKIVPAHNKQEVSQLEQKPFIAVVPGGQLLTHAPL
jgi:hypothetical protein